MRQRILEVILALTAFMTVAMMALTQHSALVSEIYIFGDSLSDVGNSFNLTGRVYPPSPPYFKGRYSNGQVWIEYLADKLSLTSQRTTNFACGGATVEGRGDFGAPNLSVQINHFTASSRSSQSTALYVVWIGANDYLQGVVDSERTIANLSTAISSLIEKGAKRLLIANLPDLGQLPATRASGSSGALSTLSMEHNRKLNRLLENLSRENASKVQILQMDVYSLYREAMLNPAKFGFSNVTSSCLNNQKVCKNPDQFLFWDGIHPTAAAHRVLGETAFSLLDQK